jgi:predicted transposase YbfD/YdcC
VHLLAGLCQHSGAVLAQLAVDVKTNEIPMLRGLVDTLDITGAVITADALHCQRATAEYIIGRGDHNIFTVKNNQPKLRAKLKTVPWKQIPILDTGIEHDHVRTAKRVLKATEITEGIGFPGAVQVLQPTRTITDRKTGNRHTEVVYALTSLSIADAAPAADPRSWRSLGTQPSAFCGSTAIPTSPPRSDTMRAIISDPSNYC